MRRLQPTAIARQCHLQHKTDFLATCDLRADGSEAETQNFHRSQNLERNFRYMYQYPVNSVLQIYWFNSDVTRTLLLYMPQLDMVHDKMVLV